MPNPSHTPVKNSVKRAAAGNAPVPRDELTVASHLYSGLQEFYRAHPDYQKRPLYITGEARPN